MSNPELPAAQEPLIDIEFVANRMHTLAQEYGERATRFNILAKVTS